MSRERTREARAVYEHWHPLVHAPDAAADAPWHRLLFRYLRDADIAGKDVLEIGCGRGELALALAGRPAPPARLVAADFAGSAVRIGRARTACAPSSRLSWIVSDIQEIGARTATFDTIVSCETLEHLPAPSSALAELYRVLRPGGRLFLTTPSYLGTFGWYRGYLRLRGRRYTESDQPISRFMLWPITALWMRGAGFRLIAIDAVGHYVLRPGRLPAESAWTARVEGWIWPFGLHSILVGEKANAG